LVDDLLVAARLGSGRFELGRTQTDLAALVRQVVAELQPSAAGRPLLVEVPDHLVGF
jgi:signal transduction histidine kinase